MAALLTQKALRSAGIRLMLQLLLIIILIPFMTGCGSKDNSLQRVQDSGMLRVGLDPTFPPFEVDTGEELVGLDIDLAEALAEELGVETHFVLFGYDGLYDALYTDQVDVLISALVVVPERQKDFAYSEPYFNAGQVLIGPADNESIANSLHLEGKTIGVELGAEGHVIASELVNQYAGATIAPYESVDLALDSILDGETDAAIVDAVSGRLYLNEHPGLKISSENVTVEPYVMVVRKDDEALLQKLDNSLLALIESGELDIIIGDWLDD